ncbi:hypothetical protein VCR26J2_370248 [Vibrio coralliirubri]|nr:hypothetical protein VCR26J2_370248 [Vibrio coralliirubri]
MFGTEHKINRIKKSGILYNQAVDKVNQGCEELALLFSRYAFDKTMELIAWSSLVYRLVIKLVQYYRCNTIFCSEIVQIKVQ